MSRVYALATLLVSFASSAYAECDFRTSEHLAELKDVSKIQSISVDVRNSRKWFQNSFKIITSKSEIIRKKYKDKLDADLTVQYDFGTCIYPARVRQSGDLKDHIAFVDGNPISSIDVRLKQGNIVSAVDFKLLLPETRNSENEVFGALFFKAMGFISPKTFFVDGDINGVKTRYLFQENAVKEMLEANYRRESAILEGDESILWRKGISGFVEQQKLSAARLSNDKWAAKGSSSLQIATLSLVELQKDYVGFADRSGTLYGYLNPSHRRQGRSEFADYHILLLAAGGLHATSPNNRKFYFNSFLNAFEPIYFDGMLKFSKPTLKSDVATHSKDVALFLADSTILEIQTLKQKVQSLNREGLTEEFAQATGAEFEKSSASVDSYLNHVLVQMDMILEIKKHTKVPETLGSDRALTAFVERSETSEQAQRIFKFSGFSLGNTANLVCLTKSLCENTRVSADALVSLLADNKLNGDRALLVGTKPVLSDINATAITPTPLGPVQHSANASVEFSNDGSKRLVLKQANPDDWFLISETSIDDWEIIFQGENDNRGGTLPEQRFNRYGLTGCLNFYNVGFDGTQIHAVHGSCEDSVNLVASSGTLSSLSVEYAFSDAIDIDFSRLRINHVTVRSAGNDCLDVSSGHYDLNELSVENCGDKGISVGEASVLSAATANVGSAYIASSKDSSVLQIDRLSAETVTTCLEAYKKKQEFDGARLEVEHLFCDGLISSDKNSTIQFERTGS